MDIEKYTLVDFMREVVRRVNVRCEVDIHMTNDEQLMLTITDLSRSRITNGRRTPVSYELLITDKQAKGGDELRRLARRVSDRVNELFITDKSAA